MKTLYALILCLILASPVWADSKITALANNGSPATTDLTYDHAGSTSYNITLGQILGLEIGTLTSGKMCTSNGTLISCTSTTPTECSTSGCSLNSATTHNGNTICDTGSVCSGYQASGTYLLGSGATTGASSQSQSFTNGITSAGQILGTGSANIGIGTGNFNNVCISGSCNTGWPASTWVGTATSDLSMAGHGITNVNNIGVGTITASATLTINAPTAITTTGNVGVGTITAAGLTVGGATTFNGSVGIGTYTPCTTQGNCPSGSGNGTVNSGTVNQVGYYASSTTAISGSSAMYIGGSTSGSNVGIGTSANQAGLAIMNGNVGIGTWAPVATFQVVGSGNVGIGSTNPQYLLDVGSGGGIRAIGIGTTVPQELCMCAGHAIGYFNGTWAGTCTCPAS